MLEKFPGVELLTCAPGKDVDDLSALQDLLALKPDVLVYDAYSENSRLILSTFRSNPEIRMIGLEGMEQRAIVIQGESHRLSEPGDLERLILGGA
jgi:hypothetical protein